MSKVMIFIDGTWLYMNTPKLAEAYGHRGYQLDFGELPRVLADELKDRLPFPTELDLVRTYLFGSYAANIDPADAELVQKRRDFFRMLREEFDYEVETFPVSFRGRRLRRSDRAPGDSFEPKEKCVDIALATAMSHFAAVPGSYDIAIAVVGDQDFMPMLQHVRRLGKRVAIASIQASCSDEYTDPSDGAHVRDFDIIWLDDLLDKLEFRFERKRRECQATEHTGPRSVWTEYRPRRGERFYCDACRQARARRRQSSVASSNYSVASVSPMTTDRPPSPLSNPFPGEAGATADLRQTRLHGIVSRKFADKGFGFLHTTDGGSYFFHMSELEPGLRFEEVTEGLPLSFEVRTEPRPDKAGLAVRVTRAEGGSPQARGDAVEGLATQDLKAQIATLPTELRAVAEAYWFEESADFQAVAMKLNLTPEAVMELLVEVRRLLNLPDPQVDQFPRPITE